MSKIKALLAMVSNGWRSRTWPWLKKASAVSWRWTSQTAWPVIRRWTGKIWRWSRQTAYPAVKARTSLSAIALFAALGFAIYWLSQGSKPEDTPTEPDGPWAITLWVNENLGGWDYLLHYAAALFLISGVLYGLYKLIKEDKLPRKAALAILALPLVGTGVFLVPWSSFLNWLWSYAPNSTLSWMIGLAAVLLLAQCVSGAIEDWKAGGAKDNISVARGVAKAIYLIAGVVLLLGADLFGDVLNILLSDLRAMIRERIVNADSAAQYWPALAIGAGILVVGWVVWRHGLASVLNTLLIVAVGLVLVFRHAPAIYLVMDSGSLRDLTTLEPLGDLIWEGLLALLLVAFVHWAIAPDNKDTKA